MKFTVSLHVNKNKMDPCLTTNVKIIKYKTFFNNKALQIQSPYLQCSKEPLHKIDMYRRIYTRSKTYQSECTAYKSLLGGTSVDDFGFFSRQIWAPLWYLLKFGHPPGVWLIRDALYPIHIKCIICIVYSVTFGFIWDNYKVY